MSTKTGQQAEELATHCLESIGLKIIDRNWRNRWQEIDIVAASKQRVHFVEVKYRSSADSGTGLDYITADKQRRLRQAALVWMTERGDTRDYQIDVLAVDGYLDQPSVEYLPNAVEGENW